MSESIGVALLVIGATPLVVLRIWAHYRMEQRGQDDDTATDR